MANTRPKILYNVEEDLSGIRDGLNTVFTTSLDFLIEESLKIHITIFKSGVKQKKNDDYFVVDGGTGFNTIIFKRPPRPLEYLTCNYLPDKGVIL